MVHLNKLTQILLTLSLWAPLCSGANTDTDSDLTSITIKGSELPASSEVFGFPEIQPQQVPLSTTFLSAQQIQEERLQRLSDITVLEASVTDSYNASGYWDYLSIRGFTLDNRANYLREGLPINAQTSIPLDNKERLEILKGLSGVQTGASSPGGVVNYVIKRPTKKPLRVFTTEFTAQGNWLIAADAGGRIQEADRFGFRLNLAHERLNPAVENSEGQRSLVSLANDWRFSEKTLLESDLEWSKRSQPSQAAFSLLGNTLPRPENPRLNLNNQSWSQPVVFEGLTGGLRLTHKMSESWTWSTQVGAQELRTDDRLAYPFGCSAENNYDRYCSDGSFDMYDFRSENERRSTQVLKTELQIKTSTGELHHEINIGYLGHVARERYDKQAYNLAGTGHVDGTVQVPAQPATLDENTQRDSQVSDLFVFDATTWGAWSGWLGLRWSDIQRSSERTDGSRAVNYHEAFALPWAALSYQFPQVMAYLSYGEGVETYVTPNRSGYTQPGAFVPDVISKQIEVGLRGEVPLVWSLTLFQITRPVVEDQKPAYQIDGEAVNRGLEVELSKDLGRWKLGASGMWLRAQRQNSLLNADLNGQSPTNLPEQTLRAQVNYQVIKMPGLTLQSRVSYEGERAVTPDHSIMIDAWTRWDVGAAYEFGKPEARTKVRFAVDNLTDHRYWKESPTQYGHLYLYPGEARSLSLTLQTPL